MFDRLRTAWWCESHLTEPELLPLAALGQDAESSPTRVARGLDTVQGRWVVHLVGCDVCDQQRAALADLALAACDSVDQRFPASRLERQVATVMRRLDGSGEGGRVLRFPASAAACCRPANSSRRWPAVAAAAGLFLGLVIGQFVSLDRQVDRVGSRVTRRLALRAPVAESRDPERIPEILDDGEAFLVEVERALTSLRSPELRALDDLTPRTSATPVSTQHQRRRRVNSRPDP